MFEWQLSLKGKVVLDECKFKVTPNNIEMKLKKQTNKKWGSLTALPLETGKGEWERRRGDTCAYCGVGVTIFVNADLFISSLLICSFY